MKRFFLLSLIFTLLFPFFSCNSNTVYPSNDSFPALKLSASHAFIYDLDNDELTLFSAEDDDRVYPASITKLLTALLALEILPPEYEITPGNEVYLPPKNSSSAFIRPHHTLTLEMLIEAMIIPSGNDAAYAVAAACGRALENDDALNYERAVARFVSEMNTYAASIGCTGSNFTTPDGFAGSDHYSTTADIALISKKASESEIIMKYAAMFKDDVVYSSGHTNTWTNTNAQLDSDSKFYNKSVVGLKTGSLEGSYSLVTVYDTRNARFIIGVFGSDNDNSRYNDTQTLINEVLNNTK